MVALYTIHKKISFSAPHMLFLIRNSFLNILTLMQKSVNYIIKLLDKISLETELSVPSSSGKDRPASVFILHILIPLIQNNSSTHSPSLSLFYRSPFLSFTPGPKKLTVKVKEVDDVNSDVEIQYLSSQKLLQPAL